MSTKLFLILALTATVAVAADGDNEPVCYGELGCLSMDATWLDSTKRSVNMAPNERSKVNTTFVLFTRNDRKNGSVLAADDPASIAGSDFKSNRPTKFIIHGYLTDGSEGWIKNMTTNLLRHGDYNVFVVDWSGGSGSPYAQAAANARLVGLEIGFLVQKLTANFVAKAADMHMIGHSLGAHISGYAGEKITGLGRISGLDPAGPYFQGMPNFVRLDSSDAAFVDVYHTNGALSIWKGGFATEELSGHLDFFPNGGLTQPGCDQLRGLNVAKCSHLRAVELFSDSLVAGCHAFAYQCDSFEEYEKGTCRTCGADKLSCALLGIRADLYPTRSRSNVRLYTKTASEAPFCRKRAQRAAFWYRR